MEKFIEYLESRKGEVLCYRSKEDRAKILLKLSAIYAESLGIPLNDKGSLSDMIMKNDPKIDETFGVMSFNMKLFSVINGNKVTGNDDLSVYLRQVLEH